MAFIRQKKVNGRTYYALVQSCRVGNKIRQKVIVSMRQQPTRDESIAEQERLADWYRLARDAHPNGRWLFSNADRTRFFFMPCGKLAEPILARIEKKLALLREWRDKDIAEAEAN